MFIEVIPPSFFFWGGGGADITTCALSNDGSNPAMNQRRKETVTL